MQRRQSDFFQWGDENLEAKKVKKRKQKKSIQKAPTGSTNRKKRTVKPFQSLKRSEKL